MKKGGKDGSFEHFRSMFSAPVFLLVLPVKLVCLSVMVLSFYFEDRVLSLI